MKAKTTLSSPFNVGTPEYLTKYGSFEMFLKDYELYDWVAKYVEPYKTNNSFTLQQFSKVLNATVFTCYLCVLFYSLMRMSEAKSLRLDCLIIEEDERLGDFYMLVGETTKTDPDCDERWIVNKRVKKAIEVAKSLAEWKISHLELIDNSTSPHLFQRVDIWSKPQQKSEVREFSNCAWTILDNAKFFRLENYRITQEDYQKALALTPSLEREDWFEVGKIWTFGYHQFRRTLAVMFALNNVSAATGQFQMKHGTREQQFHYMKNHGRLRLNSLASQEVVTEFYNEMARNIISVVEGVDGKIHPHKKLPVKSEVVNFITDGELTKLKKAQKNGAVGYRKNLLGGCMKQGSCEYGGFDTISHCSGGSDGGNMCSDLIIDSSKQQEFEEDKRYYENQMSTLPIDSPRYGSLKAEARGYENVLAVIESRKGEAQ